MKFREYRILYKGEPHVAHARVDGGRVKVASLRRMGERDPSAHLGGEAPSGEGGEARAMSGLTREEFDEVVAGVLEAHRNAW